MTASKSQQVREGLDHPVIDTDGHIQEHLPAVLPYIRNAMSADAFSRYEKMPSLASSILNVGSGTDRSRTRAPQPAWWGSPGNSRDRATAILPALLHERMDELGMDFAVLYPSKASGAGGIADDEVRQGVCRGFNDFFAEVYGPYRDRFTVVGVIPMVTPDEAIAELRHCKDVGLKAVAIAEGVLRPIAEPGNALQSPWLWPNQTHWYDTFGLDSAYDYDPLWQTFVDLGYPVGCHAGMGHMTPGVWTSTSNYVFNHVGSFAARMHPVAKSLFLGGVTKRFPTLNIAFQECGVAWACALLADLVEHWEKRNVEHLRAHLDPALVDWDYIAAAFDTYGGPLGRLETPTAATIDWSAPDDIDDFRHVGIEKKEDIGERFVPRFFFGCEADDRTVAYAFSKANPFGATVQAVFSSDIGHWDVTDMSEVVHEAHGLVRKGAISDDEFRDFVFTHPARLFLGANPSFFDGTPAEQACKDLLPSIQTAVTR